MVMTAWGACAPPAERSRLLSISFGAFSLGTCLILPIAGTIVSSFDWEAVFYFTGNSNLRVYKKFKFLERKF